MKKKNWLKSSVLSILLTSGLLASSISADQVPVQLLGVNDFHGALSTTGSAYMPDGRVSGAGSAAVLSTYLNAAEDDFISNSPTGVSLRVQAGDMVGASPANSGLLQDQPTIRAFNAMGFDYGTLGNHEFDEGLDEFYRILSGQAPTPGQFYDIVSNYRQEASNQKLVIANVIDKTTGAIPYGWQPYAIEEVDVTGETVKVGFIGVVTTEIPSLVLKQYHENYSFLNEAETIATYAKQLREQGVQAIVVLAHVPSTSEGDVASGQAAEMMASVTTIDPEHSVDIVFAGHNHVYTNGVAGNTRIVQAVSQGKAYADVRGILDTETQDFVSIPTATITATAPGVAPDPAVQAIADEADSIVATVTQAKIGTASSSEDISREVNEYKESAVGNLVTTAQLEIAKQAGYPVDFAFTNNGGIRSDLLVNDDASITWGAAQAVQPFGNILQVVELTGQQIYDALNQQYDESERYFLQISGLTYVYTDADIPSQENPYKVHKAYKADGNELDPNATYTVVINDFLFGGGDGFSALTGGRLVGAIQPDTEVFVSYIQGLEAAGQTVTAGITGTKVYKSAQDLVAEQTTTEEVEIPFEIKRVEDPELPEGTEQIVTQGVVGKAQVTKDASGQEISRTILVEPVTQVIHVGTKKAANQQDGPTPPTSSSSGQSGATKPSSGKKKVLPATGEMTSLFLSLLGTGGLGLTLLLKKKK